MYKNNSRHNGLPGAWTLAVWLVLPILLCACAQKGTINAENSISVPLEGLGMASLATSGDAARQAAFEAAVLQALAERASPVAELSGVSGLRLGLAEAKIGKYRVYRQLAGTTDDPISDVVVVEAEDSLAVVRGGQIVRLDSGFPSFPVWDDAEASFAGWRVEGTRFLEAEGIMTCMLTLVPSAVAPGEKQFDGLIVDASKCFIEPGRVVRLYDASGNIVYGPEMVLADVLVQRGMATFTASYDKALNLLTTLGSQRPLTVRCEYAEKDSIVLSGAGASAARRADASGEIFAQGRVVILVRGQDSK